MDFSAQHGTGRWHRGGSVLVLAAMVASFGSSTQAQALAPAYARVPAPLADGVGALLEGLGGLSEDSMLPMISSVSPKTGSLAGGQVVTIRGEHFLGASAVAFGSITTESITVNRVGTRIVAVAPPGSAGTVDVRVIVNEEPSPVSPADSFTFGAPVISQIHPNTGSLAGGAIVIITGNNFGRASAVTGAVRIFKTGEEDRIRAVMGPHPPGSLDLRVTVAGEESAVSPADVFTYGAPVVTEVRPKSGSFTGGTAVTIIGENLFGASSVADAASFRVNSTGTRITAVMSPHPQELVDLTVRVNGVTSAVSPADHFDFGPPEIGEVLINEGSLAAGTEVKIAGSNFEGANTVRLGNGSVISIEPKRFKVSHEGHLLTFVIGPAPGPRESNGKVTRELFVSVDGVLSAPTPGDRYSWGPPVIISVVPSQGPTTGGTHVRVFGANFIGAAGHVSHNGQEIDFITGPHKAEKIPILVFVPNPAPPPVFVESTCLLACTFTYVEKE